METAVTCRSRKHALAVQRVKIGLDVGGKTENQIPRWVYQPRRFNPSFLMTIKPQKKMQFAMKMKLNVKSSGFHKRAPFNLYSYDTLKKEIKEKHGKIHGTKISPRTVHGPFVRV